MTPLLFLLAPLAIGAGAWSLARAHAPRRAANDNEPRLGGRVVPATILPDRESPVMGGEAAGV